MKIFIQIVVILFGMKAVAYNGFRCAPSAKDTRIQVLEKDDKIEVLVVNPMGYDLMPQFESPISYFNLEFYKMQGEDLKELGSMFSFSWNKGDCTLSSSDFTVQCSGEVKKENSEIGSFGISTTEIIEKNLGQVSE